MYIYACIHTFTMHAHAYINIHFVFMQVEEHLVAYFNYVAGVIAVLTNQLQKVNYSNATLAY